MALAYLPSNKINEGFEWLKAEVTRVVDAQRLPKWTKLFDYFKREWIKVVGPKNFTVFNALDRTDNNAETYHRDLNMAMSSKPDCPVFIGMKVSLINGSKVNNT